MATDGDLEPGTGSLSGRLRAQRTAAIVLQVETTALPLLHERGVAGVTVEQLAAAAQISVRTFYRYFPTKEDVLQVQIDRRAANVGRALAARPAEEPILHSLRLGLTNAIAEEDQDRTRLWTEVVAANPIVVKGVLGGILLKTQRVIAEYVADRLGATDDSLAPAMLAAAAIGIVQATQTHWFVHGGDLAGRLSAGLEILEHGIGTDPAIWESAKR